MRFWRATIMTLAVGATGAAWVPPPSPRLVVAELFTSQGCSSCPPADALLRELAGRPDVLALGFHVTYWNSLGWADPYSLPAATARQQHYAGLLGDDSVYTPELVVDGRQGVVGSDRDAVLAALSAASVRSGTQPSLTVSGAGGEIVVTVSGAAAPVPPASVVAIGFDLEHRTPVGRGENAGRSLLEANIVRAVTPIGLWAGGAGVIHAGRPAGDRVAVLLQAADGHILAATRLP